MYCCRPALAMPFRMGGNQLHPSPADSEATRTPLARPSHHAVERLILSYDIPGRYTHMRAVLTRCGPSPEYHVFQLRECVTPPYLSPFPSEASRISKERSAPEHARRVTAMETARWDRARLRFYSVGACDMVLSTISRACL